MTKACVSAATVVPTADDDKSKEDVGTPPTQSPHSTSRNDQPCSSTGRETGVDPEVPSQSKSTTELQADSRNQIQPEARDSFAVGGDSDRVSGTQQLEQQELVPEAPRVVEAESKDAPMIADHKEAERALMKDYHQIVKDFQQWKPFTRRADGKYPADILCVLCSDKKPTAVLFPCQHKCVCNDCIYVNYMSPEYSQFSQRCMCPVCMTGIRLIMVSSGKEEKKYWKHVLQNKPKLPPGFKFDFKETGKRLEKFKRTQQTDSSTCVVS